jgi:ABC-type Zn uptake system ZnuABC Zn-binding protein ZnuA
MKSILQICLLGTTLAVGTAGCSRSDDTAQTELAVTNTYLESIVVDLLGKEAGIICLTEPGMCPGHFDVRPSQVARLRTCRLLLRFDFQSTLDAKLAPLADHGLVIAEIRPEGGLSTPTAYLEGCRQTAAALVQVGLMSEADADARLSAIAERMATLDSWVRDEVETAQLVGQRTLASVHQQGLCEWLGLKVVGTFRGADTVGVAELESAVRAGTQSPVTLVAANRAEGRRVADALADRLAATVVMLDNFPDRDDGPPHFDTLVRANVRRLLAVSRP